MMMPHPLSFQFLVATYWSGCLYKLWTNTFASENLLTKAIHSLAQPAYLDTPPSMSPLRSKTSQDLQQWRLLSSGTSLTAVTRAGSTRSFWSSAFQLKLKEPTDLKFKCQLAVQLEIEYTSIFPSSHSFDSNKSGTPNHQVQYTHVFSDLCIHPSFIADLADLANTNQSPVSIEDWEYMA